MATGKAKTAPGIDGDLPMGDIRHLSAKRRNIPPAKIAAEGTVLLEVRGFEDAQTSTKHHAARRWIDAVKNAKEYGIWAFQVCGDPQTLEKELSFLASTRAELTMASAGRDDARA